MKATIIRIPLRGHTHYALVNPSAIKQILVLDRLVTVDFKDGTDSKYMLEDGKNVEGLNVEEMLAYSREVWF